MSADGGAGTDRAGSGRPSHRPWGRSGEPVREAQPCRLAAEDDGGATPPEMAAFDDLVRRVTDRVLEEIFGGGMFSEICPADTAEAREVVTELWEYCRQLEREASVTRQGAVLTCRRIGRIADVASVGRPPGATTTQELFHDGRESAHDGDR